MTNIELTERLIDDVKKAILAKSITRSQKQLMQEMVIQMRNPTMNFKHSLDESWIALTCDITIPYDLLGLCSIINHFEKVMSYKDGEKVDINDFLKQIEANKHLIIETFKKFENPNLIFTYGIGHSEPFINLLQQKLDDFNIEVLILYNCYQKLMETRKSEDAKA